MGTSRLEGLSVRLDPTNPQRGAFSRAAGARRFCFNAAAAAIGENHAEWSAQQAGGVPAGDRVRPLSAQDLERRWRFFPSSKTCAACGTVKPKLGLGERTYHCDTCGHITDRDVNAAATLAAWGEHTLGRCPCVTQARDPNPSGRSGTPFHACGGWVSADRPRPAVVPSNEPGTSQQPPAAEELDAPDRGASPQTHLTSVARGGAG